MPTHCGFEFDEHIELEQIAGGEACFHRFTGGLCMPLPRFNGDATHG